MNADHHTSTNNLREEEEEELHNMENKKDHTIINKQLNENLLDYKNNYKISIHSHDDDDNMKMNLNSFNNNNTRWVMIVLTCTTSFSCLFSFLLLLCGTITLLVCEALLWIEIEGGGVYVLMITMAILCMVIGGMTLVVGIKMWTGEYSVNREGHLLNSKGKRINVFGGLESGNTRDETNNGIQPNSEINLINI